MMERIWILLPQNDSKDSLTAALEAGFHTFVEPAGAKGHEGLARTRILALSEDGLYEADRLVAPRIVISSPKDQEHALALAGKHDAVLVDARAWKIIPHENLIAAYHGRGTKLIVEAKDVDEAQLLLSTLERGVDIVLLPAIHAASAAKRLLSATRETLHQATITKVKPVGVGDRACLDTASLLAEDEGVLTGSASGGLFLVASEARESGYVASRPFRVNAGAVHAYVLTPGGKTRYLSELHAGDEVLVIGPDGEARPVVLGRVKIERRPLLLVEAECEGRVIKTLLQNAETIRLVGPTGTKSIVEIAPGDKVFVRLDAGGRHFGMSVDETVVER